MQPFTLLYLFYIYSLVFLYTNVPYIWILAREKCNIFLEFEFVLNIQFYSISFLKLHSLKTYLGNSNLTVTPAGYPHLDDLYRETNFSLLKSTHSI